MKHKPVDIPLPAKVIRRALDQSHTCHACKREHFDIPITAPRTSTGRALFTCNCGANNAADLETN